MQGIVIQGPTNYCKEISPLYKDTPNVVWATWEDEPIENINFIKQYVDIVLCQKPYFPGYLNINMQTVSTTAGIKYLQEKGVTEILKTRGDLHIPDVNKMLSLLKGKKAAFMVLCKEGVRPSYYELIYNHFSHDYPDNLCTYGTTENIYNAFNFTIESPDSIPPESLIAYHLLVGMGIEFNLNYEYLINNGIYFFLNDLLINNIDIIWLKHNYNITKDHSDKQQFLY
jgi:hypothetical protein